MGMIKVMEMLAARSDVSPQFFHDHWRHPHSSWGLLIHSVTGYAQGHRVTTPHLSEDQMRFEGVAEIWFDGLNDVLGLRDNPLYQKYLRDDAPLFADVARCIPAITEEEVLQSGPSPVERSGNADFAWRLERRPVSTKLIQVIEQDGEQPWVGEDDLELGHRIGVARHVRSRPIPQLHPDGSGVLGFRELWWPTYTDFETGIARDSQAFNTLLTRPAKSYAGLFTSERFPM